MKRLISVLLSFAMIVSLFVVFSVDFSAVALSNGQIVQVTSADKAPDVSDGQVDSVYAKIFDMSGKDILYSNGTMDDHGPVGFNSDVRRYDKAEHPYEEDSDWYNTRLQGFACWDSTNLYFCMVVTGAGNLDDNPEAVWNGDCTQIAMFNEARRGTVEYTFSQSAGELKCKRNQEAGLSVLAKRKAYGSVDSTTGKTILPEGGIYKLSDNMTVYEFKFAWSAFGITAAEGSKVPFNVTINMNDENMVVDAFCGFQVGTGIFNSSSSVHAEVANSPKLFLSSLVTDEDHSAVTDESPDGIRFDKDGEIRYYIDDVPVAYGLAKDAEGNYYFINSTKKAVKNCMYAFSEKTSNGLMPAGKYTFGADGKMIVKSGITKDSDGEIRYYENNQPVAKGLAADSKGNLYFFNSLKKAVRNCDYAFSDAKSNGIMPAGKYTFDADGKMVIKNGVSTDNDGEIRYYENGASTAHGLVRDGEGNYYFINSSKKAVKDTYYSFSSENANGMLPAGKYFFDSDGKLVISDAEELPADQTLLDDAIALIPDYLNEYYSENTVSEVNLAKREIDENRSSMNLLQAQTAAKNLKNAVEALQYKESDILQIFITTDSKNDVTTSYAPGSVAIVPSDKNETEFVFDSDSEIKVRGNSTALAEKKPFNFKLSSKQDLCGMGKSKKWALLANAYDKSLIRNSIALHVGDSLGVEYTSSTAFADVWVNGEFLGSYVLVENIEADKNRVDIDPENGDYLLEYEAHREESDVTYINYGTYRLRFALNEPETLTSVQKTELKNYVSAFENALDSGDWSKVQAVADVDSFVNFYIMSEFAKQVDFAFSSTRFYIKDGVFHAGPGWDYDLSMGNVGSRLYDDYILYNNDGRGTKSGNSWEGLWCDKFKWIELMLEYPEFKTAVKERFEEVAPILQNTFEDNELGESVIDRFMADYGASFDRNYNVWSLTESDLDDNLAVTRTPDPTYAENVEYLRTWLKNRYEYLADTFAAY